VCGTAGAFFFLKREPAPVPAAAPKGGPDVDALTRRLAATEVQLAQRDLDDKDYAGAIKGAEQALKVDPRNQAARQTREAARAALAALDSAKAEANAALDAGATEKASDALSRILALDPRHPAATELTARLNGVFRAKAEDARRLATTARGDAEKAKATTHDAYARASTRAREAEAAFGKAEFAAATQGFLEARDGFDRAKRAAAPASAPPAAVAAEANPVVLPPAALPQPTAAPELPQPSVAPPAVAPAPPAVPRPLVAGRTLVQSARTGSGGLSGFQSDDVSVSKIPDFLGRIDFEVSPAAVKSGDVYIIAVRLTNDGRKDIDIRNITLTTTLNGEAVKRDVAPPERKFSPRQRVTLAEVGGVWESQVASWSLDVLVTSKNGDTCRNRIELK
jgi:tetratricopeptide (TPR) repeat protein